MKKLALILFLLSVSLYSQEENIDYIYNGYKLSAVFDTAQYCTVLTISSQSKVIYTSECSDRITEIKDYDLEGNGTKYLVITYFTGGAHCCEYMTAGQITNDKYASIDTLWWGDSGHEIKDLNNDKRLEISGVDTRLGYAFTSFAGSQFPIVICQFRGGKFINVTKMFPKLVEDDLKQFKKDLNDNYLKKGYECLKEGQDKYSSTESGEVQAYLAAILEDYDNLDNIDEGFEYINKVYKCNDKKKFIETLKKDYKLK